MSERNGIPWAIESALLTLTKALKSSLKHVRQQDRLPQIEAKLARAFDAIAEAQVLMSIDPPSLLVRHAYSDGKPLIPTDSTRHPNMFRTLDLLRTWSFERTPVYLVLEGIAVFDPADRALSDHNDYFYGTHTCPTNFIREPVVAIFTPADDDPHGCFDHVRSVWMTQDYLDACDHRDDDARTDYLRTLFPETRS